MKYPTLDEVNSADHEQICRWSRFLPSPGMNAIDSHDPDFAGIMEQEKAVMDRIVERLKDFGGFTPEISKRIGWGL